MRVEDGTGGIWIHVFGDIGGEITNKSAEAIKKMKDNGEKWEKAFDEQRNKVFFYV